MILKTDIIFGTHSFFKIALYEKDECKININLGLSDNKSFLFYDSDEKDYLKENLPNTKPEQRYNMFRLTYLVNMSKKIVNAIAQLDKIDNSSIKLPSGYTTITSYLESNDIKMQEYLELLKYLYFYNRDLFDFMDVYIEGNDYIIEWNKLKEELFKNNIIFLYTDYFNDHAIKIKKELISNIFFDYDQKNGKYLKFNLGLKDIVNVEKDYTSNITYFTRGYDRSFLHIDLNSDGKDEIQSYIIFNIANIIKEQFINPIRNFLIGKTDNCIIDLRDLDTSFLAIEKALDIIDSESNPRIDIIDM